ncbi:MAG TPA: Clp protease N-terminal domain-containing protein [Actinomycetota bacterium]
MFAACTPSAHAAVVRSGRLAAEAGREVLGTDFLLLGLVEAHDFDPPLERLGITAAAVRAEIDRRHGRTRPGDRELLATLGIDLDEVRRRAGLATSTSPDDPRLWRLRRSRVRPLRVELAGPAGHLRLDGRGRKAIEVAMHYARRRRAPAGGEDLLVGLLADGSNESVRVLCRLRVDLGQLWSSLRPWHLAA